MKRGKKMLLLVAALVLCVGGYFGAQLLTTEKDSVTEESGSFPLESRTADDLTGLAWEDVAFTLADGTWSVTADPAFPLDQEKMQTMADDLLALVGTRQLDGVTDLAAYGLAEPAFSVTASWTDGTSTTYALGDETPFGDGYYISLGHENIVYTVEDELSAIFDTTMNDLAVLETLPTVTAATRLTVGSTFDIVKEEASRSINASEVWYDNATGAALDVTKADELITAVTAIAWSELAEPTASDEELSAFGVDEASATAITLYEDETAALTLLIGAQNDAGDYYARLPGSTMVYTVESSAVADLLTTTAADMPSMVIIDLSAENVQTAAFTAGEHSYIWQNVAAETAAEAADSDAETESAEETADPGESLWASILALSADSPAEAPGTNVLLTVEVTARDGQTAVLTFAEHDAEHYTVSALDRCFLVDAAKVDAIIRNLRSIK